MVGRVSVTIHKDTRIDRRKLREAARGERCTLNGPTCRYDTETTIYCHLNESFAGKGMAIKAADFAGGFFGCHECHIAYDTGRLEDRYFYLLRAVVRTQRRLAEKGVIRV